MSITYNWRRIIAWHLANVPDGWFTLNNGAEIADVESFERESGVVLPNEFRESVLLHDGGDFWIPLHGELLTIKAIRYQWQRSVEWQRSGTYAIQGSPDWTPPAISGPIKPIFWNPRRIFVTDASGEHLALDLDPPENGIYGQVIEHTVDDGPTRVVANSWGAFLNKLADDLENGLLSYCPDEDAILETRQDG